MRRSFAGLAGQPCNARQSHSFPFHPPKGSSCRFASRPMLAASVATGALVVPVFADKRLDGVATEIDTALGGALADVLESGEIAGKPNELAVVHAKDQPYKQSRADRPRRPREIHAQRAREICRHRGPFARQARHDRDRIRAAGRSASGHSWNCASRPWPKARSPRSSIRRRIAPNPTNRSSRPTSRSSPARSIAPRLDDGPQARHR